MKQRQGGYTALTGLLVVLVLVAIGAAGYYTYKKQQTPKVVTPAVTYIKATDSAKTFSFSYPDNWQIKPYVWEDCCGPLDPEPDWSKVSKPITLYPAADENITITLNMEEYDVFWESYNALLASVKEDYFAKILFEGKRADGHEALFSRVDYLGPPDAKVESFTDHRYYFDNDTSVLKVDFREKYHHDWPDDETGPDIDNSQYVPDFDHIANSVKFL